MEIAQYNKLKDKLDKQLKKIEELADQKASEIEQDNFYKYKDIFETGISILRKHDVLMYGGAAINEILPKKLKIYKEDELPDIDVFCTNEEYDRFTKDVIATFEKKGFALTTIKEALHENTYKVMVEGLQLIDVSIIDKSSYKILSTNKHTTRFGIYTVNVDYLKYTLHLLLSQSLDAHRWPKVFQRLVRLYEAFPLDVNCNVAIEKYHIAEIPKDLITKAKEYVYTEHFVGFGWDVIRMYLDEDDTVPATIKKTILDKSIQHPLQYFIVQGNVMVEAINFVKYLNDKNIKIIKGDRKLPFLPEHVVITYKGEKWIYLFSSINCSSYIEYRKNYVLSIHSTIQYLYLLYFGTKDKNIYCIIQLLVLVQMNNSLSKKKLFQQFVLTCQGYQRGLVTLRKERFIRLMKK